MSHVAFDLGLTSTGFAWSGDPSDGSDTHTLPAKYRRSPMDDDRRQQRMQWWLSTFRALLLPTPRIDVVVEAPILHRLHPTGSIETIRLHGLLAAVCADNESALYPVTPTALKKWATGRGNADKDDMVGVAEALGWCGESHDEADAWHLWRMFDAGGVS